ncbi:hypothetical protein D3C80_1818980 [compost metagenome]
MIRLASSRENGLISLRPRFGRSIILAGFFLISSSTTAASKIVESLTKALHRTPGDVHSVAAMMRRRRVVVIRSIRTSASGGIQYRLSAPL